MKVLNLRCSFGHHFEGWFASQDDFQSQLDRVLIECPVCADTSVQRLPSAPHVVISSSRALAPTQGSATSTRGTVASGMPAVPVPMPVPPTPPSGVDPAAFQSAMMRAVQHIITHTDDVGPRFAEEARRMHYGETDERPIRGQATSDEAKALHEEGIEVMAFPMPAALKGPLQ
jgi:hypothetical protein